LNAKKIAIPCLIQGDGGENKKKCILKAGCGGVSGQFIPRFLMC
jgi:hypothetical protein